MSLKSTLFAGLSALVLATPALADGITVTDAYARASSAMAQTGAAFMILTNETAADDRLVAASSPAAERVELHTHLQDANGVMRMVEVEDGFALPAGESHALQRGGDHLMFLGLTRAFDHGDTVEVTLVFEEAGEMVVMIPVDLERRPMHGQMGTGQPGTMQGMGAQTN